jgi:hypothetical protein
VRRYVAGYTALVGSIAARPDRAMVREESAKVLKPIRYCIYYIALLVSVLLPRDSEQVIGAGGVSKHLLCTSLTINPKLHKMQRLPSARRPGNNIHC